MCTLVLRFSNSSEFVIHKNEEKVSSISTKPDPGKILPKADCQVQETSKTEGFFADSSACIACGGENNPHAWQ